MRVALKGEMPGWVSRACEGCANSIHRSRSVSGWYVAGEDAFCDVFLIIWRRLTCREWAVIWGNSGTGVRGDLEGALVWNNGAWDGSVALANAEADVVGSIAGIFRLRRVVS